jgi:four helix bundle protein
MRSFRDLRVWQESHQLTLRVYELTRTFPRDKQFGLTSQMRRPSASIATNIVEGSVRTRAEFAHFLRVPLGSAAELQYQLILARDLKYASSDLTGELSHVSESIQRMLVQFIKYVEAGRVSAGKSTFNGSAEGYTLWADEPRYQDAHSIGDEPSHGSLPQ